MLEATDALEAPRDRVRAELARRRSDLTGRIASLTKEIARAEGAQELRDAGNLILGYQYQLEPKATELAVPETEVVLKLDPKLSAVENAEKYFKQYKGSQCRASVPALLETARQDLAFVDELATYVDLAESPPSLSAWN